MEYESWCYYLFKTTRGEIMKGIINNNINIVLYNGTL